MNEKRIHKGKTNKKEHTLQVMACRVCCVLGQKEPSLLTHFGELGEGLFEFLVGGDVVAHDAIVEFLVSVHVKIAGSGKTEDDVLGFAGLFAFQGFIDGYLDGVAALGSGKDAFHAGKGGGGLEDFRLFNAARLEESLVVKLGNHGTHAVIAKSAGMVCGRDKAAAKGVHFGEGAYLSGITEIIGVNASGKARAGCGLYGDDLIICLAAQHFADKRRDESAKVGTAAGAADDGVCLDAVFL